MSATVSRGDTSRVAEGAVLYVNEEEWDYHLTFDQDVTTTVVRSALEAIRARGLEPLDESEGEPFFLGDGRIRMDLARCVFDQDTYLEGAA
ncbi:hypothetical protein GCM10010211_00400 [Streptomyces albospinus]|uniref:DUF2849 domain-containing protein n=1 Tax=Streptomyces albospinus TaxID=285515 RepID=A0ABQ2UK72_9ACTN|nr:hypothetical protein [Streptomyces albospinus]GGU41360.1 hypothetical protein GCM10010211_00400 [Streptomyces albospinus]